MPNDNANYEGISEVRMKMEEDARKRKERADEEWKEFEAMRQAQRIKDEEEIKQLRERRERRRKERAEEEARMAKARAIEEQRRRVEEEERSRQRREEERIRREERERKRAEFAELTKKTKNRNFVINKRADSIGKPEEVKPTVPQKSKEELEAERKAALSQRVPPLQIDGLKGEQLKTKARVLFDLIMKLENEKYDLEQRFNQQALDLKELSERARRMNRLDKRDARVQDTPDPLATRINGLPPKVAMYSEFERVKDRRSFGERKTIFDGPLYQETYEKIQPKVTVVMTKEGPQINPAGVSQRDKSPTPPGVEEAKEPVAAT